MTRSSLSRLGQHRALRYVVAGGANALFGFTTYSVAIVLGLPVWSALVVANVAGIAFNFVTMGRYVFQNLVLARFPRFLACYAFVYSVNLAAMEQLSAWIPGKIIGQAILTLPMAVLSYILLRRFVFAPGAAKTPTDTV